MSAILDEIDRIEAQAQKLMRQAETLKNKYLAENGWEIQSVIDNSSSIGYSCGYAYLKGDEITMDVDAAIEIEKG